MIKSMNAMIGKSAKKVRWILAAPLIVIACAGYIMPRPSFYWPDMAKSKIAGKGIFVINKKISSRIVVVGGELTPPSEKQVLLGQGIRRLLADVGKTVFEKSAVLDGFPPRPEKTKQLRCLLAVDDADCQVQMTQSSEGSPLLRCAVTVKVKFEDFAKGRVGSRIIELSGQSSVVVGGSGKKLDSEIKRVVDESLTDLGRKLAAEIVNVYGARM